MDQEQNVELRDETEVAEAKGHDMKNAEAQSVASVDKAADGTGQAPLPSQGDAKHNTKKDPMPKTKAGMINAMYGKLNAMKKVDLQSAYGNMMGEEVEIEEEDMVAEADVSSYSEDLDALVESEATLSEEFKQKNCYHL